MALMYYPRVGEILVCHYDRVALGAEMVKSRPVVVIGPRLRRRADVVGVVPLSTTAPDPEECYHCKIELVRALPPPFDKPMMWAKCDMYGSVSLLRLDRFKEPRARYGGPRKWSSGQLSDEQVRAVRAAVLRGLGFGQS
jgi:uncharacterized protein YifN (PemK superfamily)